MGYIKPIVTECSGPADIPSATHMPTIPENLMCNPHAGVVKKIGISENQFKKIKWL